MDSDPELKLRSLISQRWSFHNTDAEDISLLIQIISLVISTDLESQPKSESELMSLVAQAISVFNSMDLDSQPKPLSKLISLITQKLSILNSKDLDFESVPDLEFKSLVAEVQSLEPKPELISIILQILSPFILTEPETEPEPEPYFDPVYTAWLNNQNMREMLESLEGKEEFRNSLDSDLEPESKLISLISQLISYEYYFKEPEWKMNILIIEIISQMSSMDLELQLKPESKFMSLIKQIIYVFNSMDLDSEPKPLSEFISFISKQVHQVINFTTVGSDSDFKSLLEDLLSLEPEPELMSLIHKIFSHLISRNSEETKLISLCPQAKVRFREGKFQVKKNVTWRSNGKWKCLPGWWQKVTFTEGYATHYLCQGCEGQNHKDEVKAPVEIKHLLHPKHFLQLVLFKKKKRIRKCYCCDEILRGIFYYCEVCDFALNFACVEKPRVVYIEQPKWHEHTLAQFPKEVSLPCNLCALPEIPSCTFYICPPCAFVVHVHCINLPRVIRISRHPYHRISFTPSFNEGDWLCGVCRREINNDYGGYSCIKDGCSYTTHSKCATQSNVWDGIELEDVPEEIEEEEVEPFVTISDGLIQHFSHKDHHLRFVDNTGRDYDDNKQCQACITPIYFGNFYSCEQCDFILHEACANLSCKIYHPIHQHKLILCGGYDAASKNVTDEENGCAVCPRLCTAGFIYECGEEGCDFKLHVQCATTSEPLVHGSHNHPLFLTSKPGEKRKCCVCTNSRRADYYETFNCVECDFSLCFTCATLPQKMRYKHDKHTLTLSYGKASSTAGKESSTGTSWCEICERKIKPNKRFYTCDEYCCVTLHIKCAIGKDLYVKAGSSWLYETVKVEVLPNNRHMSRPICDGCEKRCPHKIVLRRHGKVIVCSTTCVLHFNLFENEMLEARLAGDGQ